MTKELKEEWISYLQGKQYKKGIGTLCRSWPKGKKTTWCCMGVLADIAIQGEWTFMGPDWLFQSDTNLYASGVSLTRLSYPDLKQVGLTPEEQDYLIGLNDHHDTWNPVIDYIKKNL